MLQILLIEDDSFIEYSLTQALEANGFSVRCAQSLKEARQVSLSEIDLILLDLGLPDGNGISFCKEVAAQNRLPLIILTAQDEEQEIVNGLNCGADDYITKPFRLQVLLSRIQAVMRRCRSEKQSEELLRCGDVVLSKSAALVTVNGQPLHLTAGEYHLLELFLENKNRTLTRTMILEKLWDIDGEFVGDNALPVLVKRLREKLGGDPQRIIKTVRGIGYKAEDCHEK